MGGGHCEPPKDHNNTVKELEAMLERAKEQARKQEEEHKKKEAEQQKNREQEEKRRKEAEERLRLAEEEKIKYKREIEYQKIESERREEQARKEAEERKRLSDDEHEAFERELEAASKKPKGGIQPIEYPTQEEYDAAKDRVQYSAERLHAAICGSSGSGKSSLINALRGLKSGEPGAAPVGVVETTAKVTRYPDPRTVMPYPRFIWFDVPGAGTFKVPAWKYFNQQGLFIFDFIVLIYDARFTQIDAEVLENYQRFKIPVLIVRSEATQQIENLRGDLGCSLAEARDRYITLTRKDLQDNLDSFRLCAPGDRKTPRVYIVSRECVYDHVVHLEELRTEKRKKKELIPKEEKGPVPKEEGGRAWEEGRVPTPEEKKEIMPEEEKKPIGEEETKLIPEEEGGPFSEEEKKIIPEEKRPISEEEKKIIPEEEKKPIPGEKKIIPEEEKKPISEEEKKPIPEEERKGGKLTAQYIDEEDLIRDLLTTAYDRRYAPEVVRSYRILTSLAHAAAKFSRG